MMIQIKRGLPWVALVSLIVLVGASIAYTVQRQPLLVETGETRAAVESSLEPLLALHPTRADDAGVRAAAERAAQAPYVASFWLFDEQGKILYAQGSTAFQGAVADRVTAETGRVLGALPEGTLDGEQTLLVRIASAIQAEGEHNDIYRQLVRPVRSSEGRLVAVVAVAYEVNPTPEGVVNGLMVWLLVGLVSLGCYWLALPAWVFIDARERGERAWAWAVFVLLGNLAALLAYLLGRVPRR